MVRGTGPAEQSWGNSLTTMINDPLQGSQLWEKKGEQGTEEGGGNLPCHLWEEQERGVGGHRRLAVCTAVKGLGKTGIGRQGNFCLMRADFF